MVDFMGFGQALLPAVLRSLGGWAANSFSDGKVTLPEWKQLGTTICRVGVMTAAVFFGWNGMSETELDAVSAGFVAVFFDFILSAVKTQKKK